MEEDRRPSEGQTTNRGADARGGVHWRPALLSAFVFPGLGQLVDRRRWSAFGFAAASAALLLLLFQRVWTEARRLVPDDPEAILDPELPFRLAAEIRRANASFLWWVTLGLLALWALSIADAIRPFLRRRR